MIRAVDHAVIAAIGALASREPSEETDTVEGGWLNVVSGVLVTDDHYMSEWWYGADDFKGYDDPGDNWVRVERDRTTLTSLWRIEAADADSPVGPEDLFVNAVTGVLHRWNCHAAKHLVLGLSKEFYKTGDKGEAFRQLRAVADHNVILDPTESDWTSMCKVCNPELGKHA